MNKIKYLAAALVAVAGLGFQPAKATELDLTNHMHWSLNDQYLIGTVIPGDNTGGQAVRDAAMVNVLLGMGTPAQQGTWGSSSNPLYSRTTWNTTGFPAANIAGNVVNSGAIGDAGTPVQITLTGTFQYLVVAWDGNNAGVAVFDIHTLVAGDVIDLSRYARPDGLHHGDLVEDNNYRMTGWTLLNPINVPDGGTTVMLLGMGLGALGMVRRYLIG